MKQIFLYTSLAVMALAVMTTGAAPEPCDGTVQAHQPIELSGRQNTLLRLICASQLAFV
jgi:hypothetical protein